MRLINTCDAGLSEVFTIECERASALPVESRGLAEVFKPKQAASWLPLQEVRADVGGCDDDSQPLSSVVSE
jgi:hypothetical protein